MKKHVQNPIQKNSKLMDQVYFVYQAFFILMELVKIHVQKSIQKNGKLTDQVYFVYQAFFHFDGIGEEP